MIKKRESWKFLLKHLDITDPPLIRKRAKLLKMVDIIFDNPISEGSMIISFQVDYNKKVDYFLNSTSIYLRFLRRHSMHGFSFVFNEHRTQVELSRLDMMILLYFWLLFYFAAGDKLLEAGDKVSKIQITMITGREEMVLNRGESMELGCKFIVSNAKHFNLFDNPISWWKMQMFEEFQINMMSNILEPFAHLFKFSVFYNIVNFTHHFTLLISNVTVEDSANYTCVIQGHKNVVLAAIEHQVFVRNQVSSVDLILDNKRSETTSMFMMPMPPFPSERNPHIFPEELITTNSSAAFYFHENRIAAGINCTSNGGYPAPTMSVWLGSRNITHHFFTVSAEPQFHGDLGFRRLSFKSSLVSESLTIKSSDDDQSLICQASVPGLQVIRVARIINVRYGPVIRCDDSLAYQGQLNVHLRCEVKAKPGVTSLFWVMDVNKTAITRSRWDNEFRNLVRVKQCGSLEVQLHIKKISKQHFRNYVLVAENAVSVQTRIIQLCEKTYQQFRSTPLIVEKTWSFPQMQNHGNVVLRYLSISEPHISSFELFAISAIMRHFCLAS